LQQILSVYKNNYLLVWKSKFSLHLELNFQPYNYCIFYSLIKLEINASIICKIVKLKYPLVEEDKGASEFSSKQMWYAVVLAGKLEFAPVHVAPLGRLAGSRRA